MKKITESLFEGIGDKVKKIVLYNFIVVKLSDNVIAKVSLVECGHINHYEAVKVEVINKTTGPIDSIRIPFKALWGKAKGVEVGGYKGEIYWTEEPTAEEKRVLRDAVNSYLSFFCKGG